MVSNDEDKTALKLYLLQQLSAPDQQELELKLLTDTNFADELEIAEDELIDQYLTNELSNDDRARFEEHFLTTDERQRKLRSAQVIKRHLDRLTPISQPTPGLLAQLRKWFTANSVIPVTATAIFIAVVGLVIWRTGFFESDLQKGRTV